MRLKELKEGQKTVCEHCKQDTGESLHEDRFCDYCFKKWNDACEYVADMRREYKRLKGDE